MVTRDAKGTAAATARADAEAPLCYDVAVCGAGPVGLTAAALLAARDLDVVVLERNDSTSDEPKAISIDDESLRVYQQAGIIDAVVGIVVPGTGTQYFDRNNKPLFHARGAANRHGYPFKNPFSQPDLERVLVAELRVNPRVDLRFTTEVVGLSHGDDGVTLQTPESAVRARYALACDGGRSTLRSALDVTMSGRNHSDVWLVVDTLGDCHTQRYGMHHGDPHRPHVIVPSAGGRCRYEFRLFPGEGEPSSSPSFELIQRLVSRYRDITPDQIERAVNYRFHALVADRWQVGRCFLLGDAAHMMPPFAGQGLNSGIRDAGNLAWKIADVLAGRLTRCALASYESERRPHAQAVVDLSESLGQVVMTVSSDMACRRDDAVGQALSSPDGRAYLEEMRYRPVQCYTEGLVVAGSGAGVPIGQPRVFDTVSQRLALMDDVLGDGWVLLGVDVTDEKHWAAAELATAALAATSACVPTSEYLPHLNRRVLIDVDGALMCEFQDYRGCFVLLRPDHFVAAAWPPEATSHVGAVVKSWTTRVLDDPPSVPEEMGSML